MIRSTVKRTLAVACLLVAPVIQAGDETSLAEFCSAFLEGPRGGGSGLNAGATLETLENGQRHTYQARALGVGSGAIHYLVDGPRRYGPSPGECAPIPFSLIREITRSASGGFDVTLVNGRTYLTHGGLRFSTNDKSQSGVVVNHPHTPPHEQRFWIFEPGPGESLSQRAVNTDHLVRIVATAPPSAHNQRGAAPKLRTGDLLSNCNAPSLWQQAQCKAFVRSQLESGETANRQLFVGQPQKQACVAGMYDTLSRADFIALVISRLNSFSAPGSVINKQLVGPDAPADLAISVTVRMTCEFGALQKIIEESMQLHNRALSE